MAKPRKQTYTLNMYLQKIKELDIRSDADVQRLSGAWNSAMINELVVSVLNGEYIPPVILGQEKNSQAWLIDGLQRSAALMAFRCGNYRVSSSVEEPVAAYRAKARGADGEAKIDGNGDIVWEDRTFDIRRKTYAQMPEELKKAFDEYQIECVIHENYDMRQISRLVRRFNFHKPMNVSQRAFTFCDRYARRIREILKRKFFIEAEYTNAERKNGTMERILMESVMVMFHLDNWKKSGQIGQYLNENASMEEFGMLEDCIARMENIIADGLYCIFTAKDSFLWFSLFYKFSSLELDDSKFAGFLAYFKEMTNGMDMNEFYGTDKNDSTKDKNVVIKKLDRLETLMHEYLGTEKPEAGTGTGSAEILSFIRENASPHAAMEDVSQFSEVLDALAEKSGYAGKLMEAGKRDSMTAVVAYSFENDIDLDDWIADYFRRNEDYDADQAENYQHMVSDLKKYLGTGNAA